MESGRWVLLETVVPPVLGKEGRFDCFFYYRQISTALITESKSDLINNLEF